MTEGRGARRAGGQVGAGTGGQEGGARRAEGQEGGTEASAPENKLVLL